MVHARAMVISSLQRRLPAPPLVRWALAASLRRSTGSGGAWACGLWASGPVPASPAMLHLTREEPRKTNQVKSSRVESSPKTAHTGGGATHERIHPHQHSPSHSVARSLPCLPPRTTRVHDTHTVLTSSSSPSKSPTKQLPTQRKVSIEGPQDTKRRGEMGAQQAAAC